MKHAGAVGSLTQILYTERKLSSVSLDCCTENSNAENCTIAGDLVKYKKMDKNFETVSTLFKKILISVCLHKFY